MADETTTTTTVEETAAPAEPTAAPEKEAAAEATAEAKPSRPAEIMSKLAEREAAEATKAPASEKPAGEKTEPTAAREPKAPEPKETPEPPAPGDPEVFYNEKAGRWQKGASFISKEKAAELGADVTTPPVADDTTEEPGEEPGEEATEEPDTETGKTVTLEGINGRGEKVSVELPADMDEQQMRTLRMWANDSERSRTMVAEAEATRRQIDEFEAELAADPIGVFVGRVPAEKQVDVALALLADDQVYEKVSKTLDKWSYDPGEREKSAAEVRAERAEAALERREQQDRQARVRAALGEVDRTVESLVPTTFLDAANAVVETHIRSTRRIPNDEEIAGLLRDHGLSKPAADPGTTPSSPENPAASPEGDPAGESAQVQGSLGPNRAALATTPAGGTTPATRGLQVPKDIKLRGENGERPAKSFILGRLGRGRGA